MIELRGLPRFAMVAAPAIAQSNITCRGQAIRFNQLQRILMVLVVGYLDEPLRQEIVGGTRAACMDPLAPGFAPQALGHPRGDRLECCGC